MIVADLLNDLEPSSTEMMDWVKSKLTDLLWKYKTSI